MKEMFPLVEHNSLLKWSSCASMTRLCKKNNWAFWSFAKADDESKLVFNMAINFQKA